MGEPTQRLFQQATVLPLWRTLFYFEIAIYFNVSRFKVVMGKSDTPVRAVSESASVHENSKEG